MICAVNPSSKCPCAESRHRRDLVLRSTLDDNSLLDLAVNGTELLVDNLLRLVDETADAALNVLGGGAGGAGLVATLGENLGVVGRATTVPGEELKICQ